MEEDIITDEELFVDTENMTALLAAIKPKEGFYPLTLPGKGKMRIPYHVAGHAFSLEASRGESRLKENEKIDPARDRRIWIRRMNRALSDGWQIIDDLDSTGVSKLSAEETAKSIQEKRLPVSLINSGDWNTMLEVCFPGFLDEVATIQNRALAISRGVMQNVSGAATLGAYT